MIDASSFTRALRPLLRRSAGYAFSLLGERGAAEDAVQQSALRAWQRRMQFDPGRPFNAWWFAILRNHCLDELRRYKRAPSPVCLDDIDPATRSHADALDRIAVERAMNKLSDIHREVLKLRYFGELSYDELALVLDIPKGTVMSRLHLARRALAALVNAEDKP